MTKPSTQPIVHTSHEEDLSSDTSDDSQNLLARNTISNQKINNPSIKMIIRNNWYSFTKDIIPIFFIILFNLSANILFIAGGAVMEFILQYFLKGIIKTIPILGEIFNYFLAAAAICTIFNFIRNSINDLKLQNKYTDRFTRSIENEGIKYE